MALSLSVESFSFVRSFVYFLFSQDLTFNINGEMRFKALTVQATRGNEVSFCGFCSAGCFSSPPGSANDCWLTASVKRSDRQYAVTDCSVSS